MGLTVTKELPFVLKLGGQEAREIEVRQATMRDVCDAEREASPMTPNAFNVQMACRQVVRAGNFTGPFVPGHFLDLTGARFAVIAEAMREADSLGEE